MAFPTGSERLSSTVIARRSVAMEIFIAAHDIVVAHRALHELPRIIMVRYRAMAGDTMGVQGNYMGYHGTLYHSIPCKPPLVWIQGT